MGAATNIYPMHSASAALGAGEARKPAESAKPVSSLAPGPRTPDRQAFAELVKQHQAPVYGYLLARLGEPADAEDLCQEVFLRCYVGYHKLTQTDSLRAWLLGIARNVLREHIRKVKRRREVAWTELCLELDALVQDHGAAEDEALEHLPACVESLGQSAREALELRYRRRLKMAEIGGFLKRSEGAVKLLMYRARQALKNCLDRKLRVPPDDRRATA